MSFMGENPSRQARRFHVHETERVKSLNGVLLATFGQRVLGYAVDLALAVIIWAPLHTEPPERRGMSVSRKSLCHPVAQERRYQLDAPGARRLPCAWSHMRGRAAN